MSEGDVSKKELKDVAVPEVSQGRKLITMEELAKHNKDNDAWVAIHGKEFHHLKLIHSGIIINYRFSDKYRPAATERTSWWS